MNICPSNKQIRGTENGNVGGGNMGGQPIVQSRKRVTIWTGTLEWAEKAKNPAGTTNLTIQVPCRVSVNVEDGEPELKTDSWPQKLIIQFMPKHVIGRIGGAYLKNSKSVLFQPTPYEALDTLTRVMSTGFAGWVRFTSAAPTCKIKALILIYAPDKPAFFGFIPHDQTGFIDRFRKVIQHEKSMQALMREEQVFSQTEASENANIFGSVPSTRISRGGNMHVVPINTIAEIDDQTAQNDVVSNANNQQILGPSDRPQGQMSMGPGDTVEPRQIGRGTQAAMPVQRPRPSYGTLKILRQQNLRTINRLRQALEAAERQEKQYKSLIRASPYAKKGRTGAGNAV